MIEKKGKLLGKLYIGLCLFTAIASFATSWNEHFLFINIGFILFALMVFSKMRREDVKILLVLLGWAAVTLLITDGGIGSVLTFFVTTSLMIVYSSVRIEQKIKFVLCLICIVGSVLMFQQSIEFRENYNRAVWFNKNPNTISVYSLYFFMFLCIFHDFGKQRSKLLFVLSAALVIYTISNCRGRGAMIALAVFIATLLIPQRVWTKKSVLQMTVCIVIVGTAIPILYVLLYNMGYDAKFMGKPIFSGRESIWLEMFKHFGNNGVSLLVGLGSNVSLWEHDLNIHNNFLNIVVNFGIIGYCLYFYVIFCYVRRAAEGIGDVETRKALMAFICATLVLGFFESTSLNNVLAPFSYFGLVYANGKVQKGQDLIQT